MQQPEYVNCERKKDVQCEITSLDIKSSATDSLKILVFKFSKNEKEGKKKGEGVEMDEMLNRYIDTGKHEASYNHFKQVSDESDNAQNTPVRMSGSNHNSKTGSM